tara:strand:+ start:111 stop:965 length:855 start_codon:yes stop_codon:yes gene_type:complete
LSRNSDRLGIKNQGTQQPPVPEMMQQESALNFSVPTEFVELPSQGKNYPEDHPLHDTDSVEIRFMTAKDEDILTSKTLLKKGIALDRLLDNIIVDKRINADNLYIGDRNALIVAARISGYGELYETRVTCPACQTAADTSFNLKDISLYRGDNYEDYDISETENGTYMVKLPHSKVNVEVRLLTGHDEKYLIKWTENKRKNRLPESPMTDQFKVFVVSANGVTDQSQVHTFIETMPAADSRYLRQAYQKIVPNVDMRQEFSCTACGFEQEMEVPFTTDFFWPKR